MAISVTGKLNKTAQKIQVGNGVGFGVRLGVQAYNFKTKEKEWTNYSALLFANQNQEQFYESVLVEGAVIEVSGTGLIVETFDGQNGQVITLQIQEPKLGYTFTGQQPPQQNQNQGGYQQQAPQQNQGFHQPPQQQQGQQNNSFDDD